MAGNERRTAPRKACSMSLRFRLRPLAPVSAGFSKMPMSASTQLAPAGVIARTSAASLQAFEGETINLSERGIYFKSSQNLNVGEPIELFFTLPTELTGRSPEAVRCEARVVHIDEGVDAFGRTGVGASIERFEPANRWRSNWDN
jgi:PilZ domain